MRPGERHQWTRWKPADLMRSALFLRKRFVQRRYDRRALFRTWTRFVFVIHRRHGHARGGRLNLVEKLTGGKTPHLLGIENFARQQRLGDLYQHVLLAGQQLVSAVVVARDETFHFVIDLERRVFAVVLVLSDFAAEEDLLFFLAEGQRS